MKTKGTSIQNAMSTAQIILAGFLLIIGVGALLLMLPVCSADGTWTNFLDALFTATTSVCVTGLVVVPTYAYWSLTGKIIILILIQIGGLGFMTCFTMVLMMIRRRITLKERMTIQDSLGENRLSGLIVLVIRILRGTFVVEGIGALLYSIRLIPQYGLVGGIWRSVFTATSAFCNAGIDIFGDFSLMEYAKSPLMSLTTCALIIVGGIGFPVWWDLMRSGKLYHEQRKKFQKPPKNMWQMLNLHSKLAISVSAGLLLIGTIAFFLLEFHNPKTMGEFSVPEKLLASFFQSTTTRTAGFFTIDQAGMTLSSKILSILLMFVGGSPIGTAGGIKTVTIATLFFSMVSVIRGKERTEVFGRTIPSQVIRRSLALIMIYIMILVGGIMLLSVCMHIDTLSELMYEVTSALATVGLTLGITPKLNAAGKWIIIICMYIGRIGPISLAIAFMAKQKATNNSLKYPEEHIMVG